MHGTGRSSVYARASSKHHVQFEADPIEEPAIYELLPANFFPLKKRFSVSVPLIGLALMNTQIEEDPRQSVVVSAPTNRSKDFSAVQIRQLKQMRKKVRSQLIAGEDRDLVPRGGSGKKTVTNSNLTNNYVEEDQRAFMKRTSAPVGLEEDAEQIGLNEAWNRAKPPRPGHKEAKRGSLPLPGEPQYVNSLETETPRVDRYATIDVEEVSYEAPSDQHYYPEANIRDEIQRAYGAH